MSAHGKGPWKVAGPNGWVSQEHQTDTEAKREALLHLLPASRVQEVATAGRKEIDRLWGGAHAAGYRAYAGTFQ